MGAAAVMLAVILPVPLDETQQAAQGVHVRRHILPPAPRLGEDEAAPLKRLQVVAYHALLLTERRGELGDAHLSVPQVLYDGEPRRVSQCREEAEACLIQASVPQALSP